MIPANVIQHTFAQKCLRFSITKVINTCPIAIKDKIYTHSSKASSYPLSPNLCTETVVDCVSKPRIFIQCSCMIAPPRGYD